MLLIIECALAIAALFTALGFPRAGAGWFERAERHFVRLANKKRLSLAVIGGATLALRLALLPVLPLPEPAVHDEFSYLLGADTFAHRRLANPSHPLWVHFETFHVNQTPTYASMYYPAQALFLAIGKVFFGHPFWGVWLSTGLMCAAICWMLQGWFPPIWAFFGSLIAMVRLGTFSYWMNSYWGGSVAALGGALVLGALPRIRREPKVGNTVLMAVGFALIANSRPYEGIFFSIPVLAATALWIRGTTLPWKALLDRYILPLSLGLVGTAAAMGYYFWRVTGSPLRTPFQVNLATYNPVPYFPWQRMKAIPAYNHPEMRAFYLGWWMGQYQFAREHPIVLLLVKQCIFWFFFLGPLLTLPVLVAAWVLPYGVSFRQLAPRTRFFLVVSSSIWLAALLPVYFNPHYVAPITGALYALLLIVLQHVRRWRPWGRPAGIAVVRFVPLIALAMLALCAGAPRIRQFYRPPLATWYSPVIYGSYRQNIVRKLEELPGFHLVIVRYSQDHVPVTDWVFNNADIDSSRIVWARDMGAQKNLELTHYYGNRKIWLLEPDRLPPVLSPYPPGDDGHLSNSRIELK